MANNRSAHAAQDDVNGQDSAAKQKAQAAAGEAKDQAQAVGRDAKHAAQDLAQSAQQEAAHLKDEAVEHARSLGGSLQDQAREQASTQQSRLAEQSRTVADDLHRLLSGEQPQSDLVRQAVSTVADRAETLTQRLETAQPADLLDDVRRFAARRPATFLAIALGAGLVAGRMTRGLRDAAQDAPREFSTSRYTQDGRAVSGRPGRRVEPQGVQSDVAPHHLQSQVPAYSTDAAALGTPAVAGGLPYGTQPVPTLDPLTGEPVKAGPVVDPVTGEAVEAPFDQANPGGRA